MSPAYNTSLATVLFLALLGTANGQQTGFGLKAGPQLCTYKATNIRTTIIPGFTLGAYVPFNASPRLEIQPELLLTMMGSGLVEPDGDGYMLRTYYLQAPISAKFFLGSAFNIQGGFQFGKLLTAQRTDANGTVNMREWYKTFDMGLNIGIGYDVFSGTDITLRYYSGLSTLLKGDEALYPHNRSLQVTYGKRLVQLRRKTTGRRRK